MIQNIIKNYSENIKLSLMIRHGDRDKIPHGSFGNEVMLNEKGKLNSLKFGESIKQLNVNKILSSPVGRCVQTAEYIRKGYGRNIEIIETSALGNPGLHICDPIVAEDFFLKSGFDEVYERFTREIDIPGIANRFDLNSNMTNFITKESDKNGITIFITHDMIIAMYHYSLNKTIYTKQDWVNYLAGLILKNGNCEE